MKRRAGDGDDDEEDDDEEDDDDYIPAALKSGSGSMKRARVVLGRRHRVTVVEDEDDDDDDDEEAGPSSGRVTHATSSGRSSAPLVHDLTGLSDDDAVIDLTKDDAEAGPSSRRTTQAGSSAGARGVTRRQTQPRAAFVSGGAGASAVEVIVLSDDDEGDGDDIDFAGEAVNPSRMRQLRSKLESLAINRDYYVKKREPMVSRLLQTPSNGNREKKKFVIGGDESYAEAARDKRELAELATKIHSASVTLIAAEAEKDFAKRVDDLYKYSGLIVRMLIGGRARGGDYRPTIRYESTAKNVSATFILRGLPIKLFGAAANIEMALLYDHTRLHVEHAYSHNAFTKPYPPSEHTFKDPKSDKMKLKSSQIFTDFAMDSRFPKRTLAGAAYSATKRASKIPIDWNEIVIAPLAGHNIFYAVVGMAVVVPKELRTPDHADAVHAAMLSFKTLMDREIPNLPVYSYEGETGTLTRIRDIRGYHLPLGGGSYRRK